MKTVLLIFIIFVQFNLSGQQQYWEKELSELVKNKELVFIGEPDHTYGNIYSHKLNLTKHLIENEKFDGIIFESGYIDFLAYNELLKSNNDTKSLLSSSLYSIWVTSKEFQPVLHYLSKHQKQIQLLGIDCQFSGSLAVEYLICNLEKQYKIDLTYLHNSWERLSNFEIETKTELLDLKHETDSLRNSLKSNLSEELNYSLLNISNYIEYLLTLPKINLTEKEFKPEYANGRDKLMSENLLFHLKNNPNKKYIVWTANAHSLKSSKSIDDIESSKFKSVFYYLPDSVKSHSISIALTGTIKGEKTKSDSTIFENWCFNNHKNEGFIIPKDKSSYLLAPNEPAIKANWINCFDAIFYTNTLVKSTFEVQIITPINEVCKPNFDKKPNLVVKENKPLENSISLKEVHIVKQLSEKEIMKKVVRQFPKNYYQQPYSQIFYVNNQYQLERSNPELVVNRALLEEYKNDGNTQTNYFPIRYRGHSKIIASDIKKSTDTAFCKSKEFLGGYGKNYDIIENSFNNFLNKRHLKKYDFELIERIYINNVLHYKMRFSNNKPSYSNSNGLFQIINYSGVLTINSADFAVTNINFKAKSLSYDKSDTLNISGAFKYKFTQGFYFIDEFNLKNTKGYGKFNPKVGYTKSLGIELGVKKQSKSSLENLGFDKNEKFEEIKNKITVANKG